uniref:Trypsin inhibitor (Fragments) n=1 Tax=Bos taurus TaxID=9913 RepID=Q9TS73_BOVIN
LPENVVVKDQMRRVDGHTLASERERTILRIIVRVNRPFLIA